MPHIPIRRALCLGALWRGLIRAGLLSAMGFMAACSINSAELTPLSAQPKTPVQRNHTSFYPALQCMDGLFVKAKRPRVIISANQIPDKTKKISVDARGMIITAINHMSRRSKAFSFVEQGLVGRTSGDTLALEKDAPKTHQPQPIIYVNGTISQVDDAVRKTSVNASLNNPNSGANELSSAITSNSSEDAIVTLDLHLVSFPSRIVVPGTSISNSMVVSRRAWGPGLAGVISQRTLGISLQVNRVESQGQAVRSLIELGLIEMLGNYTGVPFWKCLSLPTNNAKDTIKQEKQHIRGDDSEQLRHAQYILNALGYVHVQPTGKMDDVTRQALARFQAQQGILASGALDFDTMRALEKEHAAIKPKPAARPVPPKKKTQSSATSRKENDGYQSLQVFIDTSF